MAADRPLLVLLLALRDELSNVLVLARVGVVEELVVDLGCLERVVLDADEVVNDVVGDRVLARHALHLPGSYRSSHEGRPVVGRDPSGTRLGARWGPSRHPTRVLGDGRRAEGALIVIGGVRSAAVGVLQGAVAVPTSPSSLHCAPRENPRGCRAARSRIPAFVELGRCIADSLASMKPALLQEPSYGLIESQHELRLLTRVAYGFKGPEHLIPPLSSTVVAADPPSLVGQRRARPMEGVESRSSRA